LIELKILNVKTVKSRRVEKRSKIEYFVKYKIVLNVMNNNANYNI